MKPLFCVNKKYLLALLLIIYAFNFVDRFALGLVQDAIKADLHLNDAELGLMNGLAFALFYSLMGIPIARLADRGNRVNIIALTAAVWSIMVALCGAVSTFTQLLLVRVGVGVGEAGCVPPANSLIADYFTRAERPKANALYQQGMNVSVIIAYFGAGWLNQLYGWRMMFLLVAAPGLILAVLAKLTIVEPRSSAASRTVSETDPGLTLTEVFRTLWMNHAFRHVLLGFSLWYFLGYGIVQWQPSFFIRSFGLGTGELGLYLALVYGVCGIVGTSLGGAWASRFAPDDEALQLKAMAVVNVLFNGILWAFIYISHDYRAALGLMAFCAVGGAMIYGPLFSIIQTLVPPRMRAVSIAIVLLCANLIGMGLGPLVVGVLSDLLVPAVGSDSLRYALLLLCPGYVWVSWHLWRASVTVKQDIEVSQDDAARGDDPVVDPL